MSVTVTFGAMFAGFVVFHAVVIGCYFVFVHPRFTAIEERLDAIASLLIDINRRLHDIHRVTDALDEDLELTPPPPEEPSP